MSDQIVEFGLFDIFQVDPGRPTRESLLERIGHHQEADRLGYDYIFVAERHFMPMYRAASPALILATLATTTTQARLGVLAYTLALHNPVLLAEEVSTLDHLSGGRIELGIGLGHRPQEISALGYPAEARQGIFLENLMIMRQAWEGKPFKYEGNMHRIFGALVDPPLQQPHPPIWYAGGDPDATAWAGRNGLSLAVGFKPDADLVPAIESYRSEEPPELAPRQRIGLMRHVYVAESDDQAREEILDDLQRLGDVLAAMPGGAPENLPPPPSRQEAERMYEEQVARQVIVPGSPATVAERIAASMSTLGANTFLANVHLTGVEDARVRRTLRLFAEESAPLIRAQLT